MGAGEKWPGKQGTQLSTGRKEGLDDPKPMRAAAACSAGGPLFLSSGRTGESAACEHLHRRVAPAALRPLGIGAWPCFGCLSPGSVAQLYNGMGQRGGFCCCGSPTAPSLHCRSGAERRHQTWGRESGLSSPVTVLC